MFLHDIFASTFHVPLTTRDAGQIQPTVETAAGAAVDGAARRGVLVLQAHARERASPNPTDGNASRQEAIGRHLNNSQKHRRRHHTRNRTSECTLLSSIEGMLCSKTLCTFFVKYSSS